MMCLVYDNSENRNCTIQLAVLLAHFHLTFSWWGIRLPIMHCIGHRANPRLECYDCECTIH